MNLSVSRIRAYLACGRKYYLRYVEEAPDEWLSGEMIFGSAMHYAISEYHHSGNTLADEQMFEMFNRYWRAELDEAAQYGREIRFKQSEEAVYAEQAQAFCSLYREQFQAIVPAQPEDAEMLFSIPLLDPNTGAGSAAHTLYGRIDLVADHTLFEIKVSARAAPQYEVDRNIQLTAYALAHAYIFGEPPERCVLVTLTKTKTPKIDVKESKRSPDDFRRFVEMACEVAEAIERGVYPRNLETQYGCANCAYAKRCNGILF